MFILAKDLNKEFLILIKPILDFPPKLIMHNFYVYEMHSFGFSVRLVVISLESSFS